MVADYLLTEEIFMCDYSLHAVRNRLAKESESLFVHKFHTGSKGLASRADLRDLVKPIPAGAGFWARLKYWAGSLRAAGNEELMKELPAVCVPPGARLFVEGIPKGLQEKYGLAEAEEATFTQLNAEPFRYRDAFRFKNGPELLLQNFNELTRVEVLSLALAEEPETELEEDEEPASIRTIQTERGMNANA
jgi:hypothetical protein